MSNCELFTRIGFYQTRRNVELSPNSTFSCFTFLPTQHHSFIEKKNNLFILLLTFFFFYQLLSVSSHKARKAMDNVRVLLNKITFVLISLAVHGVFFSHFVNLLIVKNRIHACFLCPIFILLKH